VTDGQTEFSSLERVCIPCSAVKTITSFSTDYQQFSLFNRRLNIKHLLIESTWDSYTDKRNSYFCQFFSDREHTFTFAVFHRPSVRLFVCNVRAPYSGDWNVRQCFYAIWYLGHLWPFGKNFTEIVPEGELNPPPGSLRGRDPVPPPVDRPSTGGVKHKRGSRI